ncbi:MAG TPA: Crp/Fnr family transcriptional regulator [Pseudonocardiaceae bacterium]|nr:Crp/Fnr family transcriptional regulator [Pseudonocardiaceae bacterium]
MRGTGPDGTWPPESFVGRLTPAERTALLARGRYATYQPGQPLLTDGDRENGFILLIHAGQVKVVMQEEQGNEHLVGIRSTGSLLGEMSYLDGAPRSASVVAVNDVAASSVAWERFDGYLREYPRVGVEIARVLAKRLRQSDASNRDIRSASVPLRVLKLIRSLVGQFDDATVIPLSQAEIAQLAHAAEVTVNKALRDFRKLGVVLTSYRKVVVPCPACLDRLVAAMADGAPVGNSVLGCGGGRRHGSQ